MPCNTQEMLYTPDVLLECDHTQERSTNTDITAVILAGGRECGQCQLASRTPPALWPILNQSAIRRLLGNLGQQKIPRAVICCNGHESRFSQHLGGTSPVALSFSKESLPSGTAGCIRDAARISPGNLFVILSAQSFVLPDLHELLREHVNVHSALTVAFCQNGDGTGGGQVYVCDRAIIRHILPCGYFDIKEGLIPGLIRAGKRVTAVSLGWPSLHFRNHREYLRALGRYIAKGIDANEGLQLESLGAGTNVPVQYDCSVHPTVRCLGQVVIMEGSVIGANTVIVGPTVIGRNVHIETDAFIENSAFWDGAKVGKGSVIVNCVVDEVASIQTGDVVTDKVVLSGETSWLRKISALSHSPRQCTAHPWQKCEMP
jgi:NDP-sugar pyrophosphorylase family protein